MITSAAFETLFRTEYVRLYHLAYGLLHDEQESQDAVSEVFATLWTKQPEVTQNKLPGYLTRATYNYCVNLLERKERLEDVKADVRVEMATELKEDLLQRDRLRQVRQFIDREMPPRMREVFDLCFGNGFSYQQAAEQLQVTKAAINKHIVHGLRLLRDRFNPTTKNFSHDDR